MGLGHPQKPILLNGGVGNPFFALGLSAEPSKEEVAQQAVKWQQAYLHAADDAREAKAELAAERKKAKAAAEANHGERILCEACGHKNFGEMRWRPACDRLFRDPIPEGLVVECGRCSKPHVFAPGTVISERVADNYSSYPRYEMWWLV